MCKITCNDKLSSYKGDRSLKGGGCIYIAVDRSLKGGVYTLSFI